MSSTLPNNRTPSGYIQRAVSAIEKARKAYERELGRACDWNNPDDVAAYKASLRRKTREMLLPATRVCPQCHKTEPNGRLWDVSTGTCLSCSRMGHPTEVVLCANLFTEIKRVAINHTAIKHLRKALGISSNQFAAKCGWSQAYQTKLENGNVKTISIESRNALFNAFLFYGASEHESDEVKS